jgi:predicted Zn-dependent protease with MMP-like domain
MPGHSARATFEDLVADALDSLPEEIERAMQNVEVVVEDEPPTDVGAELGPRVELLGLYQGVPLTKREHYTNVMPDKISIYRGPITRLARTPERIKDQVRRTVIHEVAHHFGIDDVRLEELGWG